MQAQGKDLRSSHFAFGYHGSLAGAQSEYSAFKRLDATQRSREQGPLSKDIKKNHFSIGNDRDVPDYLSMQQSVQRIGPNDTGADPSFVA